MSTAKNDEPLSSSRDCPQANGSPAIQRVSSRSAAVGGGIAVNRLLPSRQRRMIGAWCFLDHAGPAVFSVDGGLHVGPHPHIGLQTFTWMIAGEVLHRDSLGNVQVVRPGQVNLMTAGIGIAHSEESLADQQQLHAAQLWIALPASEKDRAPSFEHHPQLPQWQTDGFSLTLLAGSYGAHVAPPRVFSPLLGIDLVSPQAANTRLALKPEFEYGVLVLEGELQLNGEIFAENELAYLGCGLAELELSCTAAMRCIVLGGQPFTEEIFLWWNFVGHSKAEITEAQHDWEQEAARFAPVQGFNGPRLVAPPLPW